MAASFRWGLGGFVLGVYFGFIGFFGYSCIFFGNNTKVFNGIIEEILIPEFIEKRPFRDHLKKNEILQEILNNVNNKVYGSMDINYGYTNTVILLSAYEFYMSNFEKRYSEHYKDVSAEEIQGWDKIMLVAQNIQDEDLTYAYSSDLLNRYSANKPFIAAKDNGSQVNENISKHDEYELTNMKNKGNALDIV
jgi:hypothetical protein